MKRPVAQIAKKLDKDPNLKISIFTPRVAFKKRDKSLYYSDLENINIIDYPCINLPLKSEWPIPGLSFITTSFKILKENDILHLWVPFYISSTLLIILKGLFFRNKKLIITMDTIPSYSINMGLIINFFSKMYFKTIGKLIFSFVDCITVYGESFEEHAKNAGVPSNKIKITPTGIDLTTKGIDSDIRKQFNITKDTKIVLFVGLLVPRKGVDIIIKTASKINDDSIKFILVGDSAYRKKYEYLARKLGIKDRLIFAGFRKDVHNFYNCADVFFFPSRGEGLAGVLMEASAYKVPIVSSKIAGTEDIIKNNIDGFLCLVEAIDCYCRNIKKILDDKNLGKRFTNRLKEKIKIKYNWDKNIENFRKLYIC